MLISIILMILSGLFIISTQKIIFKTSQPSFDHYWALSYIRDLQIKRRKKNINFRYHFVGGHSNILEETNFCYPLLFHWILSFFSFDFISKKYVRISLAFELLVYVTGIILVLSFDNFRSISKVGLISILVVTNPFNRFIWNAKCRGISPRNFGIFLAYLYVFSVSNENLNNLLILKIGVLITVSLLIIWASQFSTQYVILFSFASLIFYHDIIPLISLCAAFVICVILSPVSAKSYCKGQYEHKRAWFKHIAKIDLWRIRPSLYRDFIYDFFVKRSWKYFLTNPIIEILVGFPVLLLLLITIPKGMVDNKIVFSSLFAFLITSFKYTRAFGEPQRYIEMALPALIFLAVQYLPTEYIYTLIVLNIIIFLIHFNTFTNFYTGDNNFINKKDKILSSIQSDINTGSPLILSNNWGITGYFLPDKEVQLLLPTFTKWIQFGYPINQIYPEHLFSLDRKISINWINKYRPDWFILDDYYWPQNEFEKDMENSAARFLLNEDCKPILLYRLRFV